MALPKLSEKKKVSEDWRIGETEEIEELRGDFVENPGYSIGKLRDTFRRTSWAGKVNVDFTLSSAIAKGASDVHISADKKIHFSILGEVFPQDYLPEPDKDTMNDLYETVLSFEGQKIYNSNKEYDSSYTIKIGRFAGRRCRLNIGKSMGTDFIVFRIISDNIPSLEEVGVEKELVEWAEASSGAFLLCGATATGKTTTLASLINHIYLTQRKNIITLEKPIEYIYPEVGKGYMTQRSIPEDTDNYSNGLTAALREAPHVILIGEVRNKEEVDEFLRAAETGHLAISTVHSVNTVTTLNRIRSLFEGNEQLRILSTLSDVLRGIANQVLVKTVDGEGRFAVREILEIDRDVKRWIRNGELHKIRERQEEERSTMEDKLFLAYREGRCTREEAYDKAPDQAFFREVEKRELES